MATKVFRLVPEEVAPVSTEFRTIKTQLPVPESVELLQQLRDAEPRSMGGQPPVIWDHGEGFTISDPYGNKWIDFSSGVLVTASGHAHPDIVKAIIDTAAGYDLIIIGASNEWALRQWFFGSLPDKVANNASASVLMVRSKD